MCLPERRVRTNIPAATAAAPASAATPSKTSGPPESELAAVGEIWSMGLGAPPAWAVLVGGTSGPDVTAATGGLLGLATSVVGVGDLPSSDGVPTGGRVVAIAAVELV